MKSSSIIVEGSIKDQSKKVDHSNHGDVSPPSSPNRQQLRARWTHNPVVLSMLACSTMQTCDEVKEVYRDCIAKNDKDSMMCEAAAKYYQMCHMKNGDGNSSVLNFSPYNESS